MLLRRGLLSGQTTFFSTTTRTTTAATRCLLQEYPTTTSFNRSFSTNSLVSRRPWTKTASGTKIDDRLPSTPKNETTFQPKSFVGKLKNPYKRAGGLMLQLNEELKNAALEAKPKWNPELPRVGDGVELVYKENMSSSKSNSVTGVVIGLKKRNSYNGSVRILGMVGNSKIELDYPFSSPLLSEIRTLEEAFIHRGRKRVRRSKLYYLRDLPPSNYRVAPSEITMMERRNLVLERKEKQLEKERAGMKKKANTSSKKAGKK